MTELKAIIAGFGGQGILYFGKVLAYAGMLNGRHVSWMPSYGPEMRGGTANCSVIISNDDIGSPLVIKPEVAVLMNLQAVQKFAEKVISGGLIIVDSSLVDVKIDRDDCKVVYIPATKLSQQAEIGYLGNIVALGKLNGEINFCSNEILTEAITKNVSARKLQFLEKNLKALELGYNFN